MLTITSFDYWCSFNAMISTTPKTSAFAVLQGCAGLQAPGRKALELLEPRQIVLLSYIIAMVLFTYACHYAWFRVVKLQPEGFGAKFGFRF